MESITVSVVIPVFNRDWQLRRALASVINQTFQDFEVIVIDDASTIDIKAVIDEFNDERIKLYRNKRNLHAAASRNKGIGYSKGEYIAFLDSDDEWLPEHLRLRINYIKGTDLGGVYGPSLIYKNNVLTATPKARILKDNETMLEYFLGGRLRASTPSLLLKTSVLKKFQFDVNLKQQEDYNLLCKITREHRLGCIEESTTIVHNDEITEYRLSQQWHHRSCIDSIKDFSDIIDFDILYSYVFNRMKSIYWNSEDRSYILEYLKMLNSNINKRGYSIKILNLNIRYGLQILKLYEGLFIYITRIKLSLKRLLHFRLNMQSS